MHAYAQAAGVEKSTRPRGDVQLRVQPNVYVAIVIDLD